MALIGNLNGMLYNGTLAPTNNQNNPVTRPASNFKPYPIDIVKKLLDKIYKEIMNKKK